MKRLEILWVILQVLGIWAIFMFVLLLINWEWAAEFHPYN